MNKWESTKSAETAIKKTGLDLPLDRNWKLFKQKCITASSTSLAATSPHAQFIAVKNEGFQVEQFKKVRKNDLSIGSIL